MAYPVIVRANQDSKIITAFPSMKKVRGVVTTQEPEAFAAELTTGLRDVGQVRFEGEGDDSIIFIKRSDSTEAPGEYRFAETLREISEAITIDEATWHSTWPDRSLTAASIAMLSVHIQEAIGTAPRGATILRLVSGGVVAV